MYELVKPWANTSAVVVADSYFASVQAATRLMNIGLLFIGVVKTTAREYPMKWLGRAELTGGKGDRCGLLCRDVDWNHMMLAFTWVDRDRRYFITTYSSLAPGTDISRRRLRQLDTDPNANPEAVYISIPIPEACEIYYSACGHVRTVIGLSILIFIVGNTTENIFFGSFFSDSPKSRWCLPVACTVRNLIVLCVNNAW